MRGSAGRGRRAISFFEPLQLRGELGGQSAIQGEAETQKKKVGSTGRLLSQKTGHPDARY